MPLDSFGTQAKIELLLHLRNVLTNSKISKLHMDIWMFFQNITRSLPSFALVFVKLASILDVDAWSSQTRKSRYWTPLVLTGRTLKEHILTNASTYWRLSRANTDILMCPKNTTRALQISAKIFAMLAAFSIDLDDLTYLEESKIWTILDSTGLYKTELY